MNKELSALVKVIELHLDSIERMSARTHPPLSTLIDARMELRKLNAKLLELTADAVEVGE